MRKEKAQEFAARVTQSSRSELIVIMYDVILEDCAEAREILRSTKTQAPQQKATADSSVQVQKLQSHHTAENGMGDEQLRTYQHALKHAGRFVGELMSALDFHYKLSYELRSLYIYVNKRLIEAGFSMKDEHICEVEKIIGKLREAFRQVAEQDDSAPLMANVQHLTAGLTYGRGTLNEVCLEEGNTGRGFLA